MVFQSTDASICHSEVGVRFSAVTAMGATLVRDRNDLASRFSPCRWLYQRLTLNDQPKPADLIFVLAGRMERKQYGIELYRAGFAPRLLLSVGRFEVSRMRTVAFPGVDELIAQRDRTKPDERHFFCEMNASGIRIKNPRLSRWNTYGEVLALRTLLERGMPRSLIVVSNDLHLRRIALVFERVFRDVPLDIHYCPVLPAASSVQARDWWTRSGDRGYVLRETMKLPAYRAILGMPEGLIRRIMRLRP
jgi:uncharacterized SAM-binding protein YcdF (DUF218 family)